MSTYEDRLSALERKMTHLELQRLQDKQTAEKNTPPELGRNLQEINQDMTILLGLYTRQSEAIQVIGRDVSDIKQRAGNIEGRLETLDQRFTSVDQHLDTIDQRFTGVDQRLDMIDQRFTGVDQRLDGLDRRFDRVEAVLAQILSRLPEQS